MQEREVDHLSPNGIQIHVAAGRQRTDARAVRQTGRDRGRTGRFRPADKHPTIQPLVCRVAAHAHDRDARHCSRRAVGELHHVGERIGVRNLRSRMMERHSIFVSAPLRVQRRGCALVPCSRARARSRVVLRTGAGLAVVVAAERIAGQCRFRDCRHGRIIRRRHARGTRRRSRRTGRVGLARVQCAVERDRVRIRFPDCVNRHGARRVGRCIIRRCDIDFTGAGCVACAGACCVGVPLVEAVTSRRRESIIRRRNLRRADRADCGGCRAVRAVVAGVVVLRAGRIAHRAAAAVGVVADIDRTAVDRVEVLRGAGSAGERRPILVAEFFCACTVIVAPAQSSPAGAGRHRRNHGRLLHDDRVCRRRICRGILRAEHLLYRCARGICAGRIQSLIEIRIARVVRIVFSGACENIVELTVSRIEGDI